MAAGVHPPTHIHTTGPNTFKQRVSESAEATGLGFRMHLKVQGSGLRFRCIYSMYTYIVSIILKPYQLQGRFQSPTCEAVN